MAAYQDRAVGRPDQKVRPEFQEAVAASEADCQLPDCRVSGD
jgi:hypothetical protein